MSVGRRESDHRSAMRESLAQLDGFTTVSSFLRAFYALVFRWIEETDAELGELQTAFNLLLRIEVRHHEALERALANESASLATMMQQSLRTREMLRRLLRAVKRIPTGGSRHEVIRHLLMAECYYHLGKPERVVTELRDALRMGCEHPIVRFALGYNLYAWGVKQYVRFSMGQGRLTVGDARGFRRLIRLAIEAFRKGLSGQPFDAHVHWWIGQLSEMTCQRTDAWAAYCHAARIAPDLFAAAVRGKLKRLSRRVPDATTAAEGERLSRLPPIQEDDIAALRQYLEENGGLPDSPQA